MDKIRSYISIAAKAGAVTSGALSLEKCVRSRKAKLVLIAEDASKRTKKEWKALCEANKVPCRVCGTKEMLGRSCGREYRAALALTDKGLADAVLANL